MFFKLIGQILAGPLVDGLVDVFKAYQGRKISEAEMRAEVKGKVMDVLGGISQQQAKTIIAEAQGENWLQRNWRPVTALSFTFIVVFYALLMPVAVAWFGLAPVRVGDQLLGWVMQGVLFCLGGYIGGRSVEKIVNSLIRWKTG